MANDLAEITRALSAPLGELIAAVGKGVAEAQQALDLHTLETFKAVYRSGEAAYEEFRLLGYQPTWYRIPEVTAEICVTLSASGTEQLRQQVLPAEGMARREVETLDQTAGRIQLYATPVDAGYSNTFAYDIRACSKLKFRIVPVPPSAQAEGMKVVPDLSTQSYRDAQAILNQLGIPYQLGDPDYEPRGDEKVEKTDPGAGGILATGQAVTVHLKSA